MLLSGWEIHWRTGEIANKGASSFFGAVKPLPFLRVKAFLWILSIILAVACILLSPLAGLIIL